jgi:nucleoside-triphosphatase THEP1
VSNVKTTPAGPRSGGLAPEGKPPGATSLGRARIALLTGLIGVGKTTVAERVVGLARRRELTYGGLVAPAMQNRCGQKVGIWGVDLRTGDRRVLARTDQQMGGPAVGPYSFDAEAVAWSLHVVESAIGACDLLVVDEIGKLELWQDGGLAPVLPRLAAGEATRALVLVRDSLLDELLPRLRGVEQSVFRVTEDNRAVLPGHVLDQLFVNVEKEA